ncbi:MauE/DoxX family redox-associated membrane protein [Nocardia sp. NPDC051570]|uniref:MauE/DoxX family redox-associated membrane protein n=1 Tax=Nocardia sp. NPDC051570 TaxID=3364324 RepID=UPI00379487FE
MSEMAPFAARLLLAAVFLRAGIWKAAQSAEFVRALGEYRLLPRVIVPVAARGLIGIEIICGLALISGAFVSAAAYCCVVLLIAFTAAIGINLVRGRAISCGCGGSDERTISGWLLVRNLAYVLAAGIVAMAPATGPGITAAPTTLTTTAVLCTALTLLTATAAARLAVATGRLVGIHGRINRLLD